MSKGSGRIIARRIRISPCGGGSARCSGSNRLDLHSASSACMPQSTALSTFNAIWSRGQRCGSSEPRRRAQAECSRRGVIAHPASGFFEPVKFNLTKPAPVILHQRCPPRDFVHRWIRTGQHHRFQCRHLPFAQLRPASRRWPIAQPGNSFRVVAVIPVTQGLAVHPASRAALARSMPSRALAIAISRALMRPPLSRRARRRSSSEPISARITKAGTVGSSPRTTTSATREALSMQLPWRVSINSGRYKSEIEAKNAETRQPALPDVGCWYGGCLTKISVAAEAAPPRPSERGMVK
jgi:hypothetical protein